MLCALLDVSELRMSVAQLVYLLLGASLEPVIPFSSCSELILISAVRDTKQRKEKDCNLSSEIDRVAGAISRTVCGDVCPSKAY